MTTAEKVTKLLTAVPDAILIDSFNTVNAGDPYKRTPEEMKAFSWMFDELEARGIITWDDNDMPFLNGQAL